MQTKARLTLFFCKEKLECLRHSSPEEKDADADDSKRQLRHQDQINLS